MSNFRQLIVWQESKKLAVEVYQLTKDFPIDERYGLTSQLRRATVSISANLAEGCGRHSTRDFLRFVSIATGSLAEVETLLEIACDIGLISPNRIHPLDKHIQQVGRKLNALRRSLEAKLQ